jgi:hypothetical protein
MSAQMRIERARVQHGVRGSCHRATVVMVSGNYDVLTTIGSRGRYVRTADRG